MGGRKPLILPRGHDGLVGGSDGWYIARRFWRQEGARLRAAAALNRRPLARDQLCFDVEMDFLLRHDCIRRYLDTYSTYHDAAFNANHTHQVLIRMFPWKMIIGLLCPGLQTRNG